MEDVVVRPKPSRAGAAAGGRLCVNGASHAISKPAPAPAPKIRIIHLFAPEIIQTDAANFRGLVQRLTGKQAIGNAESERRHVRRSKNKKAQAPVVPRPQPQQAVAPAAPVFEPAGADFGRQQSSSGGGETTSDSASGGYGSEEVGAAAVGPFGPEVGIQVKEEHEVLEDIWFGGGYAVGGAGAGGGGASSCSGSDVGTADSGEFGGFVDLDEFVQGLYEYPNDVASMGCSTVYTDLFGESPVSGC